MAHSSSLDRHTPQEIDGLTFRLLRTRNVSRAKRWHPGFPDDESWNLADWSNAMCGEAGEAANIVKKLRRIEDDLNSPGDNITAEQAEELRLALEKELADVVCYADLLAAKIGCDLALAVRKKFNEISERQGFPERI
jgi:NTP pyrophosphatase (non-canonical NTP hydrolase)